MLQQLQEWYNLNMDAGTFANDSEEQRLARIYEETMRLARQAIQEYDFAPGAYSNTPPEFTQGAESARDTIIYEIL